jgi:putative flippase GtrA
MPWLRYNRNSMHKIKHHFSVLMGHSAIRYLVIGGIAFGTDYVILVTCYYIFHLPLFLATSLGFITGFAISFLANRYWVFGGESEKKNMLRQSAEYVALLAFNYFFTVWTVNFLNTKGIGPSVGKLLVMGLIMCWNYALFRWVIFNPDMGKQ